MWHIATSNRPTTRRVSIAGFPLLLALAAAACGGGSGADTPVDIGSDTFSQTEDGVGSDGAAPSDVIAALDVDGTCVSEVPCVDASDCPNGTRCNTALTAPRCQVIYCGEMGSPCSEDGLCDFGLVCHSAAEGRTCADAAGEGAACADDGDCSAGLGCFHVDDAGTCRVRGTEGARCDDATFPCEAPLVCSQLRDPPVCEPAGGLGDLCGNVPGTSLAYPCDPGLTCNTLYDPPQCEPWPGPAGVRCDAARGLICDDTSWCRPDEAGAECAAKVGFDESCEGDASCLGNGFCASSDTPMVCGWRYQSADGEPCGSHADCQANLWCNTGLASPVCQGPDSVSANAGCGADIQCPPDYECLEAEAGQRRCMGRFAQGLGDACQDDTSCTPPLVCAHGACAAGATEGTPCADDTECGVTLVCGAGSSCVAAPAAGERCATGDRCGDGLGCRYGWCMPTGQPEDGCVSRTTASDSATDPACAPQTTCGYLSNVGPRCVAHGGGEGDTCATDTCRVGFRCNGTSRTCEAVPAPGAICSGYSSRPCPNGTHCSVYYCRADGGTAKDSTCYTDLECRPGTACVGGRCREVGPGGSGAPCQTNTQCAPGLGCSGVGTAGSWGACAAYTLAGERCENDEECEPGRSCDPVLGICEWSVLLGGDCALQPCAPGLACNAAAGFTCMALTLGLPCHEADAECVDEVCRLDDSGARVCLPPGEELAPCEEDGDCAEDLYCVKSGPEIPFVGAGRCRSKGGPGAPCLELKHCEYGYVCGDDHTCREPTWVP